MIVYKYKIWISRFLDFKEDYSDKFKLVLVILMLSIACYLFIIKITKTIDSGIQAQKRTDEIAKEVADLEKQNKELKAQKELYQSDSEIESQYRSLENKKKEGETVYIVSFGNEEKGEGNAAVAQAQNSPRDTRPNWKKWVALIFN